MTAADHRHGRVCQAIQPRNLGNSGIVNDSGILLAIASSKHDQRVQCAEHVQACHYLFPTQSLRCSTKGTEKGV